MPPSVCELSVVCPTVNARDNLPRLLMEWDTELREIGRPFEIIIVDDASADRTAQFLRAAMPLYPALRVLQMQRCSGQSPALIAGFRAALGKWIVQTDDDLQNDPADLRRLLGLAEHSDLVCGIRGSHDEDRGVWLKWLRGGSRGCDSHQGLTSARCGLMVFRRDVADRILHFNGMHLHLPTLAEMEGLRVATLGITSRTVSRYTIRPPAKASSRDLKALDWYRARRLSRFKWKTIGGKCITETDVAEAHRFTRLPARNCELSLVCPAFNEADNLPTLLAEWDMALRAAGVDYEMIVIDDASTDSTPDVLHTAVTSYPSLRLLQMERRSGQSAAIAAGFAAARGKWIVTCDADLQNDPNDLPRMLELTERFDMVCGWRRDRKDPWTKRLVSRFANAQRRRLLDDDVQDAGCGLKVFRRDITQRVLRFDGFHRFLPTLAKIEGFCVTQTPVRHRARVFGKTKYWIFNRFRKPIQDLRGVSCYRARRLDYAVEELARDGDERHVIALAG